MRLKMIFKFGVTVIVVVSIIIYYALHIQEKVQNEDEKSAEFQKLTANNDAKESIRNIGKNDQNIVKMRQEEEKAEAVISNSLKERQNSNIENVDTKDKSVTKQQKFSAVVKSDERISSQQKQEAKASVGIKGQSSGMTSVLPVLKSDNSGVGDGIHLAVVACGDRVDETLTLLKSAAVFTQKHLVFHIFAEKSLQPVLKDQLDQWPQAFLKKRNYYIYDITFPHGQNREEWKALFKLCASQRLFIPALLTDVDSLLYVDTDILFLRPPEDVWDFFTKFNSTQLAALAPEHEDPAIGWYNRFARHPYYGKLGVNSGVMLMNLTRLRQSTWLQSVMDYYSQYRLKITWGDQDLINIYFHYHPDQLYEYKCEWNYRPDHCMYMSACKGAEEMGVSVLHGCRRVWHNDKQPAFKAVYEGFRGYPLGANVGLSLLPAVKNSLRNTINTNCGKVAHIFTKQIEAFVKHQGENYIQNGDGSENRGPPHLPS